MQQEEVRARLIRTIDKLGTDDGADTAQMIKRLQVALESHDLEQMAVACRLGLDYCEQKKNDTFKTIVEALGGWIRSRMSAPVEIPIRSVTIHRGVNHYIGGPGLYMFATFTHSSTLKSEGGEFELSCVIDSEGKVTLDRGFRRYEAGNTDSLFMMCVWVDDSEAIEVYEM